ncbi:MAG: hypothetical protein WB952_05255 [Terriglobales bacterium]
MKNTNGLQKYLEFSYEYAEKLKPKPKPTKKKSWSAGNSQAADYCGIPP